MKNVAAVIVLILLGASVAAADSLPISVTFNVTGTVFAFSGLGTQTTQYGPSPVVSFAQFDPALGTLTSVDVQIQGTVTYNGTTSTSVRVVPGGLFTEWSDLLTTVFGDATTTINLENPDQDAADLARFTGTGNLIPNLAFTAAPGVHASFTVDSTLTITYNYTPAPPPEVPEPGTLGLLASGCVGIGYRLRRRIWSK